MGGHPKNKMATSCNTPCFLLNNRASLGGKEMQVLRALAGKARLEGQGEVLDSRPALPGHVGAQKRKRSASTLDAARPPPWGH